MEIRSLFYFVAGAGAFCLMNHLPHVADVVSQLVSGFIESRTLPESSQTEEFKIYHKYLRECKID